MPLEELPQDRRTCRRCEHGDDVDQATCGGCSRAWSGGHIEGALTDYWSEKGWSVRERAEKRIAGLEALVPHPGDGSCDRCGVVPATHVPMSLCPECYGTEKRIEALERRLVSYAREVVRECCITTETQCETCELRKTCEPFRDSLGLGLT